MELGPETNQTLIVFISNTSALLAKETRRPFPIALAKKKKKRLPTTL
jgi:hypothetical protein